jgi:hypothetical protein
VLPDDGRVIDLAGAERLRRQAAGPSRQAASRARCGPASRQPVGCPPARDRALLEVIDTAVACRADDASLPLHGLVWLPATDPPVLRDCIAFVTHLQNYYDRIGHELSPIHYNHRLLQGRHGRLFGHDREIPWPATATTSTTSSRSVSWSDGRPAT